MNLAFWRYLLLLSLLYIFWGEFFVAGGAINQLALNFALFYPLGFLLGYRRQGENLLTAYLAALIFNLLSYVIAMTVGITIESWYMVAFDFSSVYIILKVGTYIGKRAQSGK